MWLESLKRGQSLYMGQTIWIYIGPKVSFIRRLHCILVSHLELAATSCSPRNGEDHFDSDNRYTRSVKYFKISH